MTQFRPSDTVGKPFARIYVSLLLLLSRVLVVTSVRAEPVKLAVLVGLRGHRKVSSISYKQGLLLGLKEEGAAHKVDWQSLITLEFLDHRRDQARALQQVKDAIAGGAKAIVGPDTSGIGVAIRDYVLEEAGVPLIALGSVTNKLRTKHPR